jgi:hypothetical protein
MRAQQSEPAENKTGTWSPGDSSAQSDDASAPGKDNLSPSNMSDPKPRAREETAKADRPQALVTSHYARSSRD